MSAQEADDRWAASLWWRPRTWTKPVLQQLRPKKWLPRADLDRPGANLRGEHGVEGTHT